MRKKQILARFLYYTGISPAIRTIRSNCLREIPVLFYHRILDIHRYDWFPFNSDLVEATVNEFEWQMQYIRKHYNPLSFRTLADHLHGEGKLPARPIIITFDDGYDDNYYNAFPVLKKYNIPATIFLAAGYIDKEKTFWYDWLAYLILSNNQDYFEIPCMEFRSKLSGNLQQNISVFAQCIDKLKTIPNETRLQALQEIETIYGEQYTSADEEIKKLSMPLTWDQCREMKECNIEFGSHTVTHPILTSLNEDRIAFEIRESKRIIEDNIGQTVITLSFPNGRERDFNDHIINIAMDSGYLICVTAIPGINRLPLTRPNVFNRLIFDPKGDPYVFTLTLALPNL